MRYRYGYGWCPACRRRVAAVKAGNAWRHGRRKVACVGSGRAVLMLRLPKEKR